MFSIFCFYQRSVSGDLLYFSLVALYVVPTFVADLVYEPVLLTWDAARQRCVDTGGELVSILSDEMNARVVEALGSTTQNTWIGAHDNNVEVSS